MPPDPPGALPAIGRDGPGDAFGLEVTESGPELARAIVPVSEVVRQPFGLVHGGVYGVIAESLCSGATGRAVWEDGNVAMGQSNNASFLRPITAGHIHATARRRHAGRSTWIWDVDFSDDRDRLCAIVRMTIAVRPKP